MRHTKTIFAKDLTNTLLGNVDENELFSVVFVKKGNGKKRVMRAKYSSNDIQTDKQLILIDTQIGQYRRVNTDTVKIVKTKSLDLKIKRPLYKI